MAFVVGGGTAEGGLISNDHQTKNSEMGTQNQEVEILRLQCSDRAACDRSLVGRAIETLVFRCDGTMVGV